MAISLWPLIPKHLSGPGWFTLATVHIAGKKGRSELQGVPGKEKPRTLGSAAFVS
jgi:hypothetical protein